MLLSEFDNPADSEFSVDAPLLEFLPGETIDHIYDCTHVTPFHSRDGTLIVGEHRLYYVDEHRFESDEEAKRHITSVHRNLYWPYEEIRVLFKRRILLKDTGLEFFLLNGRTNLLAFTSTTERDKLYSHIFAMDLPLMERPSTSFFSRLSLNSNPSPVRPISTRDSMTEQWQKGALTNFEYLMHLNSMAGRSFNDLTQYPVFPFILKDYSSHNLDLTNPNSFRDLSKPMGAQTEPRFSKFLQKYEALESMGEKPYMYGSHYSTIGGVLHFLVRMEPFSSYLIEFQGGKFDVPDRLYQNFGLTWEQSASISASDVKELVPELFSIPYPLLNHNSFDLGVKQNLTRVSDVRLPPWADESALMFIELHRQALECDYVSEHLHEWIDLIFGYAQTGDAAVAKGNVFFPLTYEGAIDVDLITDPVEKLATITQISSFGQTPKQLFFSPHPPRKFRLVSDSFIHLPASIHSTLAKTQPPSYIPHASTVRFDASGQLVAFLLVYSSPVC